MKMSTNTLAIILCLFLISCSDGLEEEVEPWCPRPRVQDFSFRVINSDSVDLVFERQVFEPLNIVFYPTDQSDRVTRVSYVELNDVPVLQVLSISGVLDEEKLCYTLALSEDTKVNLRFDFVSSINVSSTRCSRILINQVSNSDSENVLCTRCFEDDFIYISSSS